ncbi:MAG: hypothetical protein HZC25_15645 [Rhodospirillales bacterium]|nr:hypothetical protein [Rhodospirillales bacterium]
MATHENHAHAQSVKQGSDKAFGLVFAVFFAIIGLWPLKGGEGPRVWALGLAIAFLLVALIRPDILKPLNRLWFLFGLVLHRIVSPIVMALLFFAVVTPVGLLMRLFGKDPMQRRFDAKAESYWIPRPPPVEGQGSMTNQF